MAVHPAPCTPHPAPHRWQIKIIERNNLIHDIKLCHGCGTRIDKHTVYLIPMELVSEGVDNILIERQVDESLNKGQTVAER